MLDVEMWKAGFEAQNTSSNQLLDAFIFVIRFKFLLFLCVCVYSTEPDPAKGQLGNFLVDTRSIFHDSGRRVLAAADLPSDQSPGGKGKTKTIGLKMHACGLNRIAASTIFDVCAGLDLTLNTRAGERGERERVSRHEFSIGSANNSPQKTSS